jgi:hypothetical protein
VSVYGEELAGKVMRKFGIKYAEHHPRYAEVKQAFIDVKNSVEFVAAMEHWYDPEKEWPEVVRREGPGDLVAAGACA